VSDLEYRQMSDEIETLREELAGFTALFDLQQTRMQTATALWRQEAPDVRANVWPDLGELLTWLLGYKHIADLAFAYHDLTRGSGDAVDAWNELKTAIKKHRATIPTR
jgi:hypothetical protein